MAMLPEDLQTHYNNGRESLLKKDYKEAIKHYNMYIVQAKLVENDESIKTELFKKISIVYTNLSSCFRNVLDIKQAIETADYAMKYDPDYLKAYFRKAEAHRDEKNYKQAIMVCMMLNQKSSSKDPSVQKLLSELYILEEKSKKLDIKFDQLLKILDDPKSNSGIDEKGLDLLSYELGQIIEKSHDHEIFICLKVFQNIMLKKCKSF